MRCRLRPRETEWGKEVNGKSTTLFYHIHPILTNFSFLSLSISMIRSIEHSSETLVPARPPTGWCLIQVR